MLLNIGYKNYINKYEVVSIISATSAPSRRMIEIARDKDLLIDGTMGKKTNSIIIMKSGHIVLSHNAREKLAERFNENI